MSWLIISKNKLFFVFLVFGYIFGVMLYDFLEFDYTDELMALFLLLFVIITVYERRSLKDLKPLIIVSSIFLFYIIYSLIIQSNTPTAILQDAIVEYKPYLAFFAVLLLRPQLTKQQKFFLVILCFIGIACLIVIASMQWYSEFFGHPSRFATAAVITALIYYYCTSYEWKDILVFLIIIVISLLSTRSKSYGFAFIAISYILLIKAGYKFKLNLISLILCITLIIGIAYVSWDKIYLYFIDGINDKAGMWARPALYYVAGLILIDYIPFGSGFASFSTYFSGQSYSKIYEEYGINHLWGLTKEAPYFISDAFFPSLAQYGFVGIILFIAFWCYIFNYSKKNSSRKLSYITILVICFFGIELIADTTFTHNRGMFILILLAMSLVPQNKTSSILKEQKDEPRKSRNNSITQNNRSSW